METWPGRFFSHTRTIDVFDQTFSIADVKILCRQADGVLSIQISTPDGSQVVSTRPQDGSPKAHIEVTGGGEGSLSRTLTDGALWDNVNGEWGFQGDPDDTESHDTFYLHDGAAICPPRS